MKILFLTQYYLPETGAPQNRLSSLAEHLQALGHEVTVLTAVPNYPRNAIYPGYENRYQEEMIRGIKVVRAPIYINKSKGIAERLLNYFSFVYTAYRAGRKLPVMDIIFLESPPLFLGYAAMALQRRWKARLVVNISDLWPESAEKLGIITNKTMLGAARRLEEKLYRKADLISGQTQGIIQNIRERFPDKAYHWLPNGFEQSRLDTIPQIDWASRLPRDWSRPSILYAGVLGHAQGLELLLDVAARVPGTDWILAGDGPERQKLEELKKQYRLENIYFTGNLPGEEALSLTQACTAYIVPLRRLDLFRGAIPSKLFEPLALGKPVFLGVEGEALDIFHHRGQCVIPYTPEDREDLSGKVSETLIKTGLNFEEIASRGPAFVGKYFDRKEIAKNFHSIIHASFSQKG